jgi:hypothetical protein
VVSKVWPSGRVWLCKHRHVDLFAQDSHGPNHSLSTYRNYSSNACQACTQFIEEPSSKCAYRLHNTGVSQWAPIDPKGLPQSVSSAEQQHATLTVAVVQDSDQGDNSSSIIGHHREQAARLHRECQQTPTRVVRMQVATRLTRLGRRRRHWLEGTPTALVVATISTSLPPNATLQAGHEVDGGFVRWPYHMGSHGYLHRFFFRWTSNP